MWQVFSKASLISSCTPHKYTYKEKKSQDGGQRSWNQRVCPAHCAVLLCPVGGWTRHEPAAASVTSPWTGITHHSHTYINATDSANTGVKSNLWWCQLGNVFGAGNEFSQILIKKRFNAVLVMQYWSSGSWKTSLRRLYNVLWPKHCLLANYFVFVLINFFRTLTSTAGLLAMQTAPAPPQLNIHAQKC